MPSFPIRIAILEADVPIGAARAKYGSYGGVFTSLLHKAADASDLPRERLHITGWDVVNPDGGGDEDMGGEWAWKRRSGYPGLGDVDAVLVTGSRFNAFDNDPWVVRLVEFVKKVLAQRRVRVIGVCYGHQIVGRALGAKVARSEGGAWEVSVCEVVQTERGRELFGGKDTLVGGSHSLAHYLDDQEVRNQYGKLMRRPWQSIFQMHKDLVYNYPHGVEELGSSGPCKVQGMYIPKRVITVQGHPEFTEEIVKELLEKRREQNIFGDEIYQEAMARVARPHDGVLVAKAFLRFLMEE